MDRGRLLWDCLLIVAGTVYLMLVLSQSFVSPVFTAVFVVLAGFEVVHAHRANR